MRGYQNVKTILTLLLLLVMSSGMPAFSATGARGAGSWQALPISTGELEGSSPQADGASIAVYQGSIQLDPTRTYSVPFSASPGNFSTDAAADRLILSNPHDTEGDLFAEPLDLQWENQLVPGADLVWADAATPDTLLDPQPLNDKSFCAQNLAGRHLVVWPRVNMSTPLPQLFLTSLTGAPHSGTVSLQDKRVAIDIASAADAPVTVSANHYDATLKAAKVKVGESITLTVTTKDCAGTLRGNVPFIISRRDAVNRQGSINNSGPVQLDTTELTTADTQYHGVTDASGTATVTVTQNNGPGVKTTLRVSAENYAQLSADVDVIFTTVTSPDSNKAAMWGHMAESTTVNGFTFSRPALAAEASSFDATVSDHNETWAQFSWSQASSHCQTLVPDVRQLSALNIDQQNQTVQDTLGWPLQGDYYWSASAGKTGQHYSVNMRNRDAKSLSDSTPYLASCVDRAAASVTPKITLTTDHFDTALNAAKVKTSETILMKVAIVDSVSGEPLPYYYYTLKMDTAKSRNNKTNAAWETTPVEASGESVQAVDAHDYQGVTDANGEAVVTLSQPQGAGVRTTIIAGMRQGYSTTDSKDVIFTVLTSPDSDKARMWGHMKEGIVAGGDVFARPFLTGEGKYNSGTYEANNESWVSYNSLLNAQSGCESRGWHVPSVASLKSLYAIYPDNAMASSNGWPTEPYSYLAADTSGSQYNHVDLKTGNASSFTAPGPANYLACIATSQVAQIQVTTNGDASQRLAKVKVGETITLDVLTTNAVNGLPAPRQAFTITSGTATNRQGTTTGFHSGGPLIVNGVKFGTTGIASGSLQVVTDDQGKAQLVVEQPGGSGLKTPLTIKLVDSRVADTINYDVIFTTINSPDTDKAKMWGHMDDSVTVGDLTFSRPKLTTEFATPPQGTNSGGDESWGMMDHSSAQNSAAGGCDAGHLPTLDQLMALYNANPDNAISTKLGWPVSYSYWSSNMSLGTSNSWENVYMTPGTVKSSLGSAIINVTCVNKTNPVATQLTMEVVDSAQWSDTASAAKAKKGDTIRFKLMTKDGAGNPVSNAPIVISRGDEYSRQNVKQGSVGITINGLNLGSTSSQLYASSDASGSLLVDVQSPYDKGTRTAITAKLYDTNVIASLDAIFTVANSPDSPKAQFWGHMPETLTAEDGTILKRPLLFDELTQTSGYTYTSEVNEKWARFTYAQAQNSGVSGCGDDYIPTKSTLDSLYNAYPQAAIHDLVI